jgi:hypothetical protein
MHTIKLKIVLSGDEGVVSFFGDFGNFAQKFSTVFVSSSTL